MATNENLWNTNKVDSSCEFEILAESDQSFQIIMHQNTVAFQFHILKEYDSTVAILQNYVDTKINSILTNSKIDMTVNNAEQ